MRNVNSKKLIIGALTTLVFVVGCTKSDEGSHTEATTPPPATNAPTADGQPPPGTVLAPVSQTNNCAQRADGSTDPNQIDCNPTDKADTGFTTVDGLKFTGTGNDNMLDVLRGVLGKDKPEEQRKGDMIFAQSIQDAKILIPEDSNQVSISIVMDSQSGHREVKFGGQFHPGGEAPLKLSKDDAKSSPPVRASILCLDTDSSCEMALVKFQLGPKNSAADARILFRTTGAQLYFQLPEQYEENADYLLIDNFLYDSKADAARTNRTREILAQSFEVSNGRSGFRVAMIATSGEVVGFSGPLLAPENGTSTNVPVTVGNDWIDSANSRCERKRGQRRQEICSPISSRFQNARMVKNNGRGQIVINAGIGSSANHAQNKVTLQFMFKTKPVVGLDMNKL